MRDKRILNKYILEIIKNPEPYLSQTSKNHKPIIHLQTILCEFELTEYEARYIKQQVERKLKQK